MGKAGKAKGGKAKQTSALAEWSITLSFELNPDHATVVEGCKVLFKKWCFQKEKGHDTGYVHWQMNGSTWKRVRKSQLFTLIKATGWKVALDAISPMSSKGKDSLYCMKLDTRVEGPWSDKDPKPRYVQRRFRDANPKAWQSALLWRLDQMKADQNDRNIVLVNDEGGEGKSWFKGWAHSTRNDVMLIPASMERAEDMIQGVCDLATEGWDGIIAIDVPRATSAKHWYTMAAGLETIKQGFLYDKRYKMRQLIIEPPQIVCFMNTMPPEGVMSRDVFIPFDKEVEAQQWLEKEFEGEVGSTTPPPVSLDDIIDYD